MTERKQDEKRPVLAPVKGRLPVFLAHLEGNKRCRSLLILGAQASVGLLATPAKLRQQ